MAVEANRQLEVPRKFCRTRISARDRTSSTYAADVRLMFSKPRTFVVINTNHECFIMFAYFNVWGKLARCRIEKKEENGERTQTRRHPRIVPTGSVRKSCKLIVAAFCSFLHAAKSCNDHNHPNSLQRGNYRNENSNISGK